MHRFVRPLLAGAFLSATWLVAGIAYQEVANTDDNLMDHFIPRAHAEEGLVRFFNYPPEVIGNTCPVPDIYNGKQVQPTEKLLEQNATLTADARGRVSNAYCKDGITRIVVDWENGNNLLVGTIIMEPDVVVDN